jgi:hypothetical protein
MPEPIIKITWPEAELSRLIGEAEDNVLNVVTDAIQDLKNEIQETTPVVTGHLLNSWVEGLNEAPQGGSGEAYVIGAITIGDSWYFINTAVYARRVEYGFVGRDSLGRVYNQAGRGWIRAAIARWPEIVESAVARFRR